jgi:hypothetical protein
MTAVQMAMAVGQQVYFVNGSFRFLCTVKDIKMAYGQMRLLISPLAGTGEQWVEFSRLQPVNRSNPPALCVNLSVPRRS